MSGIATVVDRRGGPAGREPVERMLGAMAHRGPDGRRVWADGPISLGHLLMRTTPAPGEQPLVRGARAITADCRIDNRDELVRALCPPGAPDLSDPALILLAYERWGEDCASHLLGDFAFVIWDGERRTLLCARDHFGVKPLYYHAGADTFAVASEIKGLFALAHVPRQIDEQMVGDHLTGHFEDPAITYWQGVHRVPAAHTLTVDASGRASTRRYWSLDPERELRLDGDEEYAHTLRTLFTSAVERRTAGARPIGSTLSGGIDSTAVACMAAMCTSDPVHSFSLVFDSLPAVDERRWIEPALRDGRFVAHLIAGDELDPLAMLDDMLRSLDGIFYAPNLYLHAAMYAEAAASGVRVLLDGFDGDSTLSHGIERPRDLLMEGRVRTSLREVRGLAVRQERPLATQLRRSLAPTQTGLNRARHRLLGRTGAPPEPWSQFGVIAPAFAGRMRVRERNESLDLRHARAGHLSRVRAAHHRQLAWPVHAHALEAMDRVAAAHSVEPRYPFYDIELVEFCLAMPSEQKLRHGWTRWVMRRAMEGILPPEVQWRAGKSNLGPVLTQALHRNVPAVEELLRDPDAILPYVDFLALRERWERFRRDPSPKDVMPVWVALVLERGLTLGTPVDLSAPSASGRRR